MAEAGLAGERALTDPLTGLPNIRALKIICEFILMLKCAVCGWITWSFEPPLRHSHAGPLQTDDYDISAAIIAER
jgi:hypothetical protein